jgi:hypothetical protein
MHPQERLELGVRGVDGVVRVPGRERERVGGGADDEGLVAGVEVDVDRLSDLAAYRGRGEDVVQGKLTYLIEAGVGIVDVAVAIGDEFSVAAGGGDLGRASVEAAVDGLRTRAEWGCACGAFDE